jgi:hypothetical protein
MGGILGAIRWGNYVAHSKGWNFWCNIGELGVYLSGVPKWVRLGAILVNWVGYLSDPLKF